MQEKKHIVHIAFRHGVDDTRILRKECISLAKKKIYDVTYITSDMNSRDDISQCDNVKKIIIKAGRIRIIRQLAYIKEIRRFLKHNRSVDLIHLHEPTLLLLALFAKRRGIAVVFDSHEDYYRQIPLHHKGDVYKVIAHLYKKYEKYVCKKIDAVVCPCRSLVGEIFDYQVNRLIYLDNYPILLEASIDENKKEFLACYVGTISHERGVINAIKAWKMANVKGVLAGRFSNSEIEKEIKSMNEFENVEFRGYCGAEELDEIYRKVSVGMATLLDYGQYHKTCNFSTKVYEYMMYGIPVIIYRSEYVEKIMEKYKFGIMVNPERTDEISEALCFLQNNPSVAKEMGENGRKAVREIFNWQREEKKMYLLYECSGQLKL